MPLPLTDTSCASLVHPSAIQSGSTPLSCSPSNSLNAPTLSNTLCHFPSPAFRDDKPKERWDSEPSTMKHTMIGGFRSVRQATLDDTGPDYSCSQPPLHFGQSEPTMAIPLSQSAELQVTNRIGIFNSEVSERQGASNTESADQAIALSSLDTDTPPFAFMPQELVAILKQKNLDALVELGGVVTLLKRLGTHPTTGLTEKAIMQEATKTWHPTGMSVSHRQDNNECGGGGERPEHDEFFSPACLANLDHRRRTYGHNYPPQLPRETFLRLMWSAFKDKAVLLLFSAAVVLLSLHVVQHFRPPRDGGNPPSDWVKSITVLVVVLILVLLGSLNNWQKARQFQVLNEKNGERSVKVIRNCVEQVINVKEMVVGDVALFAPGEIVPCDGVFLSGCNVKCDESHATVGRDIIMKASYDECLARRLSLEQEGAGGGGDGALGGAMDCFIISGSKVVEGFGRYVVVAVGQKSLYGNTMLLTLGGDSLRTPLQLDLERYSKSLAKVGRAAGVILFTVFMFKFIFRLSMRALKRTTIENSAAFVNILIISLALIIVAVPEGLPFVTTLALGFVTKRMTHDKLLVRALSSCETMANVSVVCTDKTVTLTQNIMNVVAGSVGIHAKFVRHPAENEARSKPDELDDSTPSTSRWPAQKYPKDFSLDQAQLNSVLSPQLRVLFHGAICVNSIAFEDHSPETSNVQAALLKFAKDLGCSEYKRTREMADVRLISFSGQQIATAVVVKLPGGNHRVYLKGSSEILVKRCTHHVIARKDVHGDADADREIKVAKIDGLAMDNVDHTINFYANQSLRTIALCYRDLDSWPPPEVDIRAEDKVLFDDLSADLVLIAITAIEDPLRPDIRDAVEKCRRARVSIKLCTGDNVYAARSLASKCGIHTAGGLVMEGPEFRNLNEQQMLDVVPNLQVLARSTPEDKNIVVQKLRQLGEIVSVTGDVPSDVPALRSANVGFSMAITGTEVVKDASDIILMDSNFNSIVKAIMWGRCFDDCVRKVLQLQISTNVTAVVVTLVSAFASSEETPVFSAVQLLWIHIIGDIFATLGLVTDHASEKLLDRKPNKKASLFSVDIYKQIFFQSMYQIIVILTLHFAGPRILGFPAHPPDSKSQQIINANVHTVVFNSFVFALIFNTINCRSLDKKLNILEGVTLNYYLLAITSIEIAVQILIVFLAGATFQVIRISVREWILSLALGSASIPIGALVRLLPNAPFEILFISMRLLPTPEVLPTARPECVCATDRQVQHACDSLRSIPQDARSPALQPTQRQRQRVKASHVIGILGSVLAFTGVVLTGIQTTQQRKA